MITAVNGQPVRDFEDLTTYLARTARSATEINLTILRNGNVQSVTVTLAARPAEAATSQAPSQQRPARPRDSPASRAGRARLRRARRRVPRCDRYDRDARDRAGDEPGRTRQGVLVVERRPRQPG